MMAINDYFDLAGKVVFLVNNFDGMMVFGICTPGIRLPE